MRVTRRMIIDCLKAFLATKAGTTVHWRDMSQAVKAAGLEITDWMTVRNELQTLINLVWSRA